MGTGNVLITLAKVLARFSQICE